MFIQCVLTKMYSNTVYSKSFELLLFSYVENFSTLLLLLFIYEEWGCHTLWWCFGFISVQQFYLFRIELRSPEYDIYAYHIEITLGFHIIIIYFYYLTNEYWGR